MAVAGLGTAFASTENPIAANEWALDYLNVNPNRDQYGAHGADVIVAVMDTGVDPNQPDLKGRLVDGIDLVKGGSGGPGGSGGGSNGYYVAP